MRLVKEGREHGQAVGYLDDGTMVVVEKASDQIGSSPDIRVTNVIQTTTGRMVFAALVPDAASSVCLSARRGARSGMLRHMEAADGRAVVILLAAGRRSPRRAPTSPRRS